DRAPLELKQLAGLRPVERHQPADARALGDGAASAHVDGHRPHLAAAAAARWSRRRGRRARRLRPAAIRALVPARVQLLPAGGAFLLLREESHFRCLLLSVSRRRRAALGFFGHIAGLAGGLLVLLSD